MTELKPCPFCGAKPKMHEYLMTENSREYAVWCMNGRLEKTHACYTFGYSTREQAAEAWNRRADDE